MKWLVSVVLALAVAGFSMAGSKPQADDSQRIVLITGSTGGLGREVARSLAAMGGLEPAKAHEQAYDPAVRAELWAVSEALTAGPAPMRRQ